MVEKEIYAAVRELFVLLTFGTSELLRPYYLTNEQYDTLLALTLDSGWRMGDLGKMVFADNSKMTRTVDYLESQGWAERRPDPDDRRAQRVFLTAEGAEYRQEIEATHNAALQNWLSDLMPDAQTQLNQLLDQLRIQLREKIQ